MVGPLYAYMKLSIRKKIKFNCFLPFMAEHMAIVIYPSSLFGLEPLQEPVSMAQNGNSL